jgi:hypothetical protein
MWFLFWLTATLASERLYTYDELVSGQCDTGCQRDHYMGGFYLAEKKKCRCYDDYGVERITRKKLVVPHRNPGRHFSIYEGTLDKYVPTQQ